MQRKTSTGNYERIMPSSATQKYRYEPLTQPGHIRLMTLSPRTALNRHNGRLQCTLTRKLLSADQRYDALSYCWGGDEKPYDIFAGWGYIPVTASLYAALTWLQHNSESRTLWIDAICINQDDVEEKNKQVAQMRYIYKSAYRVISWLGPSEDASWLAMSWIKDFGARAEVLGLDESVKESEISASLDKFENHVGVEGKYSEDVRLDLEYYRPRDTFEGDKQFAYLLDLYRSLFLPSKHKLPLGYALEKMLWRDYWQRAWIVQEIYNARKLQFVCGEDVVDERSFRLAVRFLRVLQEYRYNQAGEVLFPEFGTFKADAVFQVRRSGREGASLPLIYLLRHFRGLQCKLRVDKLYSLLGIATDADQLNVTPDYAAGDREGITQIAQALLQNGYVEILSLCRSIDRLRDFPSWVPDWGDLCEQEFLFQRHMRTNPRVTELQPRFDAATKLPFMLASQFSRQRRILTLASIRLGEITELGMVFDFKESSQWLKDLLTFSNAVGADSATECLSKAFATAVADQRIREEDQKPRADGFMLQLICRSFAEDWLTDEDGLMVRLRREGFGEYSRQMFTIARNRKPMKVGEANIGLAPQHARVGDEVRLVAGAQVPYIFRKIPSTHEEGMYKLVGEAYVHGIMDGEAVETETANLQLITVV